MSYVIAPTGCQSILELILLSRSLQYGDYRSILRISKTAHKLVFDVFEKIKYPRYKCRNITRFEGETEVHEYSTVVLNGVLYGRQVSVSVFLNRKKIEIHQENRPRCVYDHKKIDISFEKKEGYVTATAIVCHNEVHMRFMFLVDAHPWQCTHGKFATCETCIKRCGDITNNEITSLDAYIPGQSKLYVTKYTIKYTIHGNGVNSREITCIPKEYLAAIQRYAPAFIRPEKR